MTLVSRSIPALYGGVSQQPATLRSDIQLEDMVNCWATIVDGCGKRPGSQHVAKLSDNLLSDCAVHIINRDVSEQYVVVVSAGSVLVFDMNTGHQQAVNFPYGTSYLNVPAGRSAHDTFRLTTVADYTFVVNRSVTVQQGVKDSDRATSNYNYYNVSRAPGATGAQYGSYQPNPSKGNYMGVVQTFQDLPNNAAEGATYQIRATSDSNFAGYYVRRTQGTWIEVTSVTSNNTIDANTMPWALVRLPNGTFELAPFSWGPRRAGDEVTNPGPSFLGRQINDVLFAENRLGFLCDESIVLSRAGDYGMFWRMTVTQALDDDYIDVSATETQVTEMMHAIPMLGSIMLFSDQVQFRMEKGSNGAMTPSDVSLTPVTHYPTTPNVPPEALGADIYFTSEQGGWARLLQYYVRQDGTNSTDADDVSAHVPRYIPQGVRGIATSTDLDAVFTITSGNPSSVYAYKFYWNGDQLAQSAWGRWDFGPYDNVIAIACLGTELFTVVYRPGGTYLEKVDLSATAVAPGFDHDVYLDRRMTLQGSYNSQGNYTIFDLPWAVQDYEKPAIRVIRSASSSGPGGLADPSTYQWIDQYTLLVPGNLSSGLSFVGLAYNAQFTFSRWFMKDQQGNPDLSGRLQVRTVSLYYNRTGYFLTNVSPYGTDPDVQVVVPSLLAEYTGKTIGNSNLLVGNVTLDEGVYSFQVYGNAADCKITISNDSHLPSFFTSAEVEFLWQTRAQFT